jgi:hypothetical protein
MGISKSKNKQSKSYNYLTSSSPPLNQIDTSVLYIGFVGYSECSHTPGIYVHNGSKDRPLYFTVTNTKNTISWADILAYILVNSLHEEMSIENIKNTEVYKDIIIPESGCVARNVLHQGSFATPNGHTLMNHSHPSHRLYYTSNEIVLLYVSECELKKIDMYISNYNIQWLNISYNRTDEGVQLLPFSLIIRNDNEDNISSKIMREYGNALCQKYYPLICDQSR